MGAASSVKMQNFFNASTYFFAQTPGRISYLLIVLIALVPLSCAIPVMPTGGPVDKIPPVIVKSTPEAESVNVDTEKITIVFSEYIDQASFAQSVSITPPFDRPLEYRWKRQQVEINLPDTLRNNTTYILSLDTNLRDVNRVALTQPITLAFATGPEINKGRLDGKVVNGDTGEQIATMDVFAYAMPDSTLPAVLPESPDYRTQTDQNGAFSFEYLSEQPYFVIALDDRNRNRTPDGIEPFAVPPTPFIFADSSKKELPGNWLVTSSDTIPPELQRVRSISSRRFSLRFSESIELQDLNPENWAIRDSVSNAVFPVDNIYLYPEDPRMVYLLTQPLFASRHALVPGGIADSSGNPVAAEDIFFTPSSTTDTLQTRFLGFYPDKGTTNEEGHTVLRIDEGPALQFNQPVPTELISEHVSAVDTMDQALNFSVSSDNGSVFNLQFDAAVPGGIPITVRVNGNGFGMADTTFERTYQQMTEADLGELSGVVAIEDSAGTPVVQLYPEPETRQNDVRYLAAEPDGTFKFSRLPAGVTYRFKFFLDLNENLRWDGGQILPYIDAEPVSWHKDSLQVRARWEQTLPDTLRIPRR